MAVIQQPSRFAGSASVEVISRSACGAVFEVRKRDGEVVLTFFVSGSDLLGLLFEMLEPALRLSSSSAAAAPAAQSRKLV